MNKSSESGFRDTGSDQPSSGQAERPSGAIEGAESVPSHGEPGQSDFETTFTTDPPRDVPPEVPPYAGRKESADPGQDTGKHGARTAGATAPTPDPDYKSPAPGDTAGGATASPAQEEPATHAPESGRDVGGVGPAHVPGTGRGEQKR